MNVPQLLRACRLAVWFALLCPVAAVADDGARPVRLRFEWGGGLPRIWNGVLELGEGRFERPVSLGVEADEPGSLWADGRALWIQRRTQRIYDGFDVTVVAAPTTRLVLTLQAGGQPDARRRVEFVLGEITAAGQTEPLGESQGRLVVRRAPGDLLAVQVDRPHLVYSPGERFEAAVAINVRLADYPGLARLQWELRATRGTQVLKAGSFRVDGGASANAAATRPIGFELPKEEGAYDLVLSLSARGLPPIGSTVQVVVVDSQPRAVQGVGSEPADEEPADVLVDSFRPAAPGFRRRIEPRPVVGWLPASWGQAFERGLTGEPDSRAGKSVAWKAYRLNVQQPGEPHRLAMTLPADFSESVGLSLLEPNAAGQLMPIGIDAIIAPESTRASQPAAPAASGEPPPNRRELVFWPRVEQPVLLVHDLGGGRSVELENVELYQCGRPSASSLTMSAAEPSPSRLVGLYLHKPLLPESFGATEALDPASGRSLDDWATFHTAGRRLMEHLHAEGCNSLLLAVLADGSTIYPSELLQPTPRYDTGAYFATGQDPLRKDVLEMLLRQFDREGLTLVPSLQFTSPLPALERTLASGGDAVRGIELIGRDGRSWREARGARRGAAPYYNPLDPRVQAAIGDVVRELTQRYYGHESFQGLAVELSSEGYLQLPGLSWGYDDATVARFEQATGVRVPVVHGSNRHEQRFQYLTTQARTAWVRWRCEELAAFHKRLAAIVTEAKPTARFILAGHRTLHGSNPDDRLDAALAAGGDLPLLLPPKGLDFSLYSGAERMIVLRPSLWGALEPAPRGTLDEAVNFSPALDAAFRGPQTGVLLAGSPREFRVADFDEVSPWQPAYTWLAAHPWPAPHDEAKRMARAVANDPSALYEGGWVAPLWTTPQRRRARRLLASLPGVEFRLHETQQQPAVVRVARHGDKLYVLAVNDFDGACEIGLQFSSAPSAPARTLPEGAPLPLTPDGTGSRATLRLGPYEIWACEIGDPAGRLLVASVKLSDASLAGLQQRIRQFDQQLADILRSGERLAAPVENPGFEQAAGTAGPPGWKVAPVADGVWLVDRENPHSGQASLQLSATKDTGAVLEAAVPRRQCRVATLNVWLRSDRPDAEVQLTLEVLSAGRSQAQSATVRADGQWRRHSVSLKDLPFDAVADAALRIEARGAGRVWVDDVEIELQRIGDDDRRQLTKVFSSLTLAWEQRRYADCLRLLESTWGRLLTDAQRSAAETTEQPPREATRNSAARTR